GHEIREPLEHPRLAMTAAYSPDGEQLLTGHFDSTATVNLWDLASRKLVQTLAHGGVVRSVAFSPDGKTFLTGSFDGTARLWDRTTGQPLGPPLSHESMVQAAVFSPDGKYLLTGSNDRTARLWKVGAGFQAGPLVPRDLGFFPLAFSHDCRKILTRDADHMVQSQDAVSGQEIGKPLRHGGPVSAAAVSPDGWTVVTVEDRTTRLWNAAAAELIAD